MSMKKRLLAIASLLMALCLVFPSELSALAADGDVGDAGNEVVIYHTNDTHGYLSGDGAIGIDVVAGLKESSPDAILVDAGDATQGLPLASLTRGADVIGLMNLAGYDLMVAGNHEFDFGTGQFLDNVALADFPILAANIWRDGQPLLQGAQAGNNGCHTVIERDGYRIGFFGLTTTDTATSTNPAGISDLTFRDEVETAMEEIDALEAEGVDAIVAVCHLGDGDASCTSLDLAGAMTGAYQDKIDVIIDGHSHTEENDVVNGILIVQTGANMAGLGELTLTFDGEGVTAAETLLTADDLADVTPKAEVTEALAAVEASQAELLGEVVGAADTTLWGGSLGVVAIARLVETNYGDLVADAFRDAGETFLETVGGADAALPVIAVENGGGIRAGTANGEITMGDLIEAFPFANTLYLKKVTPQILYAVMEQSGVALDGQDPETGMLLQGGNSGGFLQISGFTVAYDPNAPFGERVTSITLEGQDTPLDPNDSTTEIVMVGNNYIMSGGSDYTMLGQLPKYGEAGGELETIQAYLEGCLVDGTLQGYAGTKNRIQMRGEGYVPGDYAVSIQIVDEAGSPLAGQALSYRVDGGARQNGVTDESGMLQITLADGAHGVRLADGQPEIYIDNYSGFGIYVDQYRAQPQLTFLADGSCDPVEEDTPQVPEQPEEPQEPEQPETPEEPGEEEPGDQPSDGGEATPGNDATAQGQESGSVSAPKTGDGAVAAPAAVLLCCAGAALILLGKRSKGGAE